MSNVKLNIKMNRRVFATSVVGLAASPLLVHAQTPVALPAVVGQAAPDFNATDALGKSHKLSDFKGKLVVLEWTNPGCPFVAKHYSGGGQGNMQRLQKEFTAKGVVWLSIASTEKGNGEYYPPAKMVSWVQDKQAKPSAVLMDELGKIGQLYGAKTTPHMYIISPQGVLVYSGAIDSVASARVDDIKTATNYVRQGLSEALAGKAVSTPSTRAYGCSVKYKDA
ncbi:MAG: thioredoxin family protein [Chitinophagaceae bacterium]|nr:thioredoxin family protein [Polaromonas sp.]